MGIYILISVLYLGFLGVFYLGFKELKSFKETYYADRNFNTNKFQNIEDFYNKTLSQTQDLSNLVNSYKDSISEIISEYETLKLEHENYINTSKEETNKIRKVYEEDKVMENFHNMLNLMNKFEEDQKQIQGYLTKTIYKLEKNPEKLRLEFKKLFNTHKQQISTIQKTLSELEKSVLNFHNFYTKEISSLRRDFSNQNK